MSRRAILRRQRSLRGRFRTWLLNNKGKWIAWIIFPSVRQFRESNEHIWSDQ